jgi:hypothetical protein
LRLFLKAISSASALSWHMADRVKVVVSGASPARFFSKLPLVGAIYHRQRDDVGEAPKACR